MHLNLIEALEDTLGGSDVAISAVVPDWTRETATQFWDPGRKLRATIRAYEKWNRKTGLTARILRKILVIRHRFWSVVTGADIPLNCQIGGGLLIPHPNGVVIHPDAVIGVNCLIFQQVTIGARSGAGLPVLCGHCDIGAGGRIPGDGAIGVHAKIGANAVVTKNVATQITAVGAN